MSSAIEEHAALLDIGSMSPPGYPSAWLPSGRSRLRFTWQVIVTPPRRAVFKFQFARHLPARQTAALIWNARH